VGCVEGWVVQVCVNMYFELTLEVTSCLSASHAFSQIGIVCMCFVGDVGDGLRMFT